MRSITTVSLIASAGMTTALPTFSWTSDDAPARRLSDSTNVDVSKWTDLGACTDPADTSTCTTYYPFVFCKTMKHRSKSGHGFCAANDVDKLLKLIVYEGTDMTTAPESAYDGTKLDTIVQQGDSDSGSARSGVVTSKLVNPFSGCAFGRDPKHSELLNMSDWMRHGQPSIMTSREMVFEMVEVYAMGVLRDEPFENWEDFSCPAAEQSVSAQAFCTYKNYTDTFLLEYPNSIRGVRTTDYKITGNNLFRGMGQDEDKGKFVSQFLLQTLPSNGLLTEQMYPKEEDAADSLYEDGWLKIQNGRATTDKALDGTKYVYNMRMLGSIVHSDKLYQIYYNAALTLLDRCGVTAYGLEGSGSHDVSGWLDGDVPDVMSALATVSNNALQAAWYYKWKYMRIRPEAFAQRIMLCQNEPSVCENESPMRALKDVLDTVSFPDSIKKMIHDHNAAKQPAAAPDMSCSSTDPNSECNLYLPLQYPEGSPNHPAWPAGHAVVAGACVTVLKAMLSVLDTDDQPIAWPQNECPAKKSSNGESLEPMMAAPTKSHGEWPPVADSGITIVGELNKLASNVALGRNMAGVHYRSDGDEGILLGEQVAIKFLQDRLQKAALQELHSSFRLSMFNGSVITIQKDYPFS